ncbi:carboxypeptidase inhibitor SmCI-like [Aquarana catesbeiana]|uniref:carboxypeptidase inhibitor SmCI-like n=1 Tax=Aquarana catesbeiana TaxID=8400 RepID=UPI003CCA2E68
MCCFFPVPVCDQPLDPGPCNRHRHGHNQRPIPRYYYDKETGTCKPFFYDGCGRNENSFATQEDCKSSCIPAVECYPPPPPIFGRCNESIPSFLPPSYYYDQWTKTCKRIDSRCRGFGINFDTKEECERTCKPVLDCDQLLKPDSCKGYIPRYYYDKETGTCKSFIYGGCGGNENNFTTKEKCEATCMPVKGTSPMWDYFWMSSLDDEHMFS